MKKISNLILKVALLAVIVAISACGPAAKGKKAAKEFCDCVKQKQKSEEQCERDFYKKYGKLYDTNKSFEEAFDKEQEKLGGCD